MIESLTVGLVCLLVTTMSANEALPPDELSPQARGEVDALSMKLPDELARRRNRETFRDMRTWLRQRAPMPLGDELHRVDEMHIDFLSMHREVETPPIVEDVLAELIAALPRRFAPAAGEFEVTVVDLDQPFSATAGQNHLYLSTRTLKNHSQGAGGRDRLAFLLAQQIADSVLGHTRSWYQARWTAELVNRKSRRLPPIQPIDTPTPMTRSRSRVETKSIDLFALHLCRLAGFSVDAAVDVVRFQVLDVLGRLPRDADSADGIREPLRRLRQLNMERRGIAGSGFGLRIYSDGQWTPLEDKSLAATKRAIVLIHGLDSDLETFNTIVRDLDRPDEVALLGLAYPANDSLYRAAGSLANEFRRTAAATAEYDFVCHSAGGLVFRHAAEVRGLRFRHALLIGTPNDGSEFTKLRPLIEAQQFFGTLAGNFSKRFAAAVENDTTQLVRDLEPDSLFLADLQRNGNRLLHGRYHVVRGRAMSSRKALLLALGTGTARAALNKIADSALKGSRRRAARGWVNRLRVPEEVRRGDLAVTLESASLDGAADVLTVSGTHTKLPDDEEVIAFVHEIVTSD